MGWRTWDAFAREAHERWKAWKALPWRERIPLRWLVVLALAGFIALLALVAFIAAAMVSVSIERGGPF